MSINPFDTNFDPSKALLEPLESFLEVLPTKRDRAIFKKSSPVNNIAACTSVTTAPFRLLKPTIARCEVTATNPRVPVEGLLQGLHRCAAKGPLSVLLKAVDGRFRVLVILRQRHCIDGTVEGFLIAFDKHFNLVLAHASVGAKRLGTIFVRGENVVIVRLL